LGIETFLFLGKGRASFKKVFLKRINKEGLTARWGPGGFTGKGGYPTIQAII